MSSSPQRSKRTRATVSTTVRVSPPDTARHRLGATVGGKRFVTHQLVAPPIEAGPGHGAERDDFYPTIAGQLRINTPWRRRKFSGTHWLYTQLNDLSKQLDPATYTRLAQQPVNDTSHRLDFPGFVAEVLGTASVLDAKHGLGSIPMTHLGEFLRVLIPLACPEFDRCPAGKDVERTYRNPTVVDHLQPLADGTT